MNVYVTKEKSVIKCEGRFHGLRDYLYSEVMPLVLEDRTTVSPQDISNLWELISSDIHFFDPKDPYFDSRVDSARKQPLKEPISLSPLIEMPAYRLAPEVIHQYAIEMGNKMAVADNLVRLSTHNRDFFRDCFNRDPKTIVFPTGKNLAGYAISGDVGIGTIVPGGISGGGIRSDAPF